jgi:alkanesulfonate monooxygenase SsuD/methylene tetrahydromethanopterin reductase-like flavin-dependent oxidoreductase (luciferase family)
MHFTAFHLMPYRPLDMTERRKYRTGWVSLPNALYDPKKGADEYESFIDQLAYAEQLGFDAISVNEHHQTAYGMMPAPNLIASALIQRTKRVQIAVLGRALPLVNNPMFIAEELAMLDVMSRGRLIAGFVRGIGAEYHSSGVNPAFSHERFHEAHDLIVQAWTKPGPFEFHGEHYNVKYVNLWPRPYQTPRPPIWIPSQGSSETVKWAAHPDRKYKFLVTFSSQDLVTRYLTTYRAQCTEFGYECSGDQLGWALPVYVADTDEQAKEEAGYAVETLFGDYLPMPWEVSLPPGYTSMESMKRTMSLRAVRNQGRRTADELIGDGTALIGSAKTVREKIACMVDRTGVNSLATMLQFGVLPDHLAKRNMERFAAEVMPHFR